jgi:glycerophosphoryl diester phosphodiesterase
VNVLSPPDRKAAASADTSVVLTIAHRGASGYAPENTFAAFDVAVRMGAHYLELDIRATADGVLVALHDEALDRTTWGTEAHCSGPVATRTIAQLRSCEVGSWFDVRFEGERIPTVDAILDRYGRRASLCLELKAPAGLGVITSLLELVERHRARDRVLIQSYDASILETIAGLDPSLALLRLSDERRPATALGVLLGAERYAAAVGVRGDALDSRIVDAAHTRGLHVHVHTVNHRRDIDRVIAAGVDAVVTDFPDRVLHATRSAAPSLRAA